MSYRQILLDADEFFRRIMAEQPQHFQCGNGCSLCCYGMFEIGSGDVPVIAEGLARLPAARRRVIIQRAKELMETSGHPNLRECSAAEKEAFYARNSEVRCPALSESGACEIYESRPLVCRTFGLPVREAERYIGDICELNFTTATDDEKQAAAWDLMSEDALGPEDEFTVAEAIVIASRLLKGR